MDDPSVVSLRVGVRGAHLSACSAHRRSRAAWPAGAPADAVRVCTRRLGTAGRAVASDATVEVGRVLVVLLLLILGRMGGGGGAACGWRSGVPGSTSSRNGASAAPSPLPVLPAPEVVRTSRAAVEAAWGGECGGRGGGGGIVSSSAVGGGGGGTAELPDVEWSTGGEPPAPSDRTEGVPAPVCIAWSGPDAAAAMVQAQNSGLCPVTLLAPCGSSHRAPTAPWVARTVHTTSVDHVVTARRQRLRHGEKSRMRSPQLCDCVCAVKANDNDQSLTYANILCHQCTRKSRIFEDTRPAPVVQGVPFHNGAHCLFS